MGLDEFTIFTVGRTDYIIYFWFMTKTEAVDRMKNVDLSEKVDNYDH